MPFADEVVRSLHDPNLYRAAAARSLLRSVMHLGRLALLSALALTTAATLWLSTVWRDHVRPVLDAVPTITIRDGVASVDGPQPWVRRVARDAQGHEWLILLDTTGRTDFARDERGVLLGRTELRIKSTKDRVDTVPLERVGNVKLGPKALRRAILWRLMLVPPALLAAALAWFLLVKTLQALLLAAWIKRLGRRRAVPLAWSARLGIASHALTAAVLFDCFTWWVSLPLVLAWPAYWALAALYAAAGERQIADASDDAS